jgi:ABC-type branched-subunit amino acid transport system substrate-binding protein
MSREIARKELPLSLCDRVAWVYEDDRVTPKLSVNVSRKFLQDPQLLGLVTFPSNDALAVSRIAAVERVPMLAIPENSGLLEGNPDVSDHADGQYI